MATRFVKKKRKCVTCDVQRILQYYITVWHGLLQSYTRAIPRHQVSEPELEEVHVVGRGISLCFMLLCAYTRQRLNS